VAERKLTEEIFDACVDVLRDYAEVKGWDLNEREIRFVCRKASRNPLRYQSLIADELKKRDIDPLEAIGITRETLEKMGWMGEEYSASKAVRTVRGEIPIEEGVMEFGVFDIGVELVLNGRFVKEVMERYGLTEEDWEELEIKIAEMAVEGRIPTSAIVHVYVMDKDDAEDLLREGIPVLEGAFNGYTVNKSFWREAVRKLWEKAWR